MNTKIAAVLAVAIIVVAGAGAYIILNNRDSGNGLVIDSGEYPTNLMVLGNANMDDYLDSRDIAYIEALIDQVPEDESAYSEFYSEHYFADANYDGKIDSSDVAYVQSMVNEAWDEITYIYYLDANFEISRFDMTMSSRNLITLICPPLDNVLILNPDLLVGTDMRPVTGKYMPQYEGVLADIAERNNRTLYNVGIASSPTLETISQAAAEYGGELVVVCGDDSYGPGMEDTLAGSGVQVVRLPTWEYGGTIPGLLTLAYILDVDDSDGVSELDVAYDYIAWYTEIEDYVQECVSEVSEEDRPGASAVYAYTDPMQILGTYTGEYNNLLKLGVEDVTGAYMGGSATGGHGNQISTEVISELVANYGLDVLIGLVGTPFQVEDNSSEGSPGVDQATTEGLKSVYDKWVSVLGAALGDTDFFVTGYSFLSGASEPLGELILGYYLYGEEYGFTLEYLEQKVDEYCKWIGIYDIDGDGVTETYDADGRPYEWCFANMNLLYAGEGNSKNIMNRDSYTY
ncbi:MAG: hypothetical protein Q4Q62_05035 [Thermoplasmata archaeon]|nr:hypothetical protein [Thermoplasmata archaeon]